MLSKSALNLAIPSLFPGILDRGKVSTKPMNIYIDVGVTAFPIICHVKKRRCEYNNNSADSSDEQSAFDGL